MGKKKAGRFSRPALGLLLTHFFFHLLLDPQLFVHRIERIDEQAAPHVVLLRHIVGGEAVQQTELTIEDIPRNLPAATAEDAGVAVGEVLDAAQDEPVEHHLHLGG